MTQDKGIVTLEDKIMWNNIIIIQWIVSFKWSWRSLQLQLKPEDQSTSLRYFTIFTGCGFLSESNSDYVFWHSGVFMVLRRHTWLTVFVAPSMSLVVSVCVHLTWPRSSSRRRVGQPSATVPSQWHRAASYGHVKYTDCVITLNRLASLLMTLSCKTELW